MEKKTSIINLGQVIGRVTVVPSSVEEYYAEIHNILSDIYLGALHDLMRSVNIEVIESVFYEVASKFENIKDEQQKRKLVNKRFGESSKRIFPFLQQQAFNEKYIEFALRFRNLKGKAKKALAEKTAKSLGLKSKDELIKIFKDIGVNEYYEEVWDNMSIEFDPNLNMDCYFEIEDIMVYKVKNDKRTSCKPFSDDFKKRIDREYREDPLFRRYIKDELSLIDIDENKKYKFKLYDGYGEFENSNEYKSYLNDKLKYLDLVLVPLFKIKIIERNTDLFNKAVRYLKLEVRASQMGGGDKSKEINKSINTAFMSVYGKSPDKNIFILQKKLKEFKEAISEENWNREVEIERQRSIKRYISLCKEDDNYKLTDEFEKFKHSKYYDEAIEHYEKSIPAVRLSGDNKPKMIEVNEKLKIAIKKSVHLNILDRLSERSDKKD
ncbi:MAG: hypothetical protein A2315_12385 [Ignavibacteria bacterium RIFOXYB2_FULL_35_12]|nr:MAG: hypothetical protein A2006_05810 [Ignavibacteria bacterium GWC2_35_8]OGU60462.1 MAG: hypothetical protein A2X60_03050 [Ignavibacteria bacterium GWF2_35_20]OGU83736.1 MAG: hypothetical protein A2254_07555 [Ignavibacteria bacterium RIFOXYA2_FULL_35_9]OGU84566.1 MAG: hypothetical protein A3K31_09015 [Ignavibacteria bacterium RIFOXYA12_FULL_35_25]OGU96836.1 MAG: hypothetical protein A2347_14380 [Ignavibacteria bacterium RIFOXYB12_FULL_35_14]OGV01326.1 MAG: hypothetical protein A2455_04700 